MIKKQLVGKIQIGLGLLLLLGSIWGFFLIRGYFWDQEISPGYSYYDEYQNEINADWAPLFEAMNSGEITGEVERAKIYAAYSAAQINNKSTYETTTILACLGLIIEATLSIILILQGLKAIAKK